MAGQLFEAHRQWRDRAPDERFASLKDLHEMVLARRQASVQSRVRIPDLRFEYAQDLKEVVTVGSNSVAVPTHWAFTQLCDYVSADARWLRRVGSGPTADLDLVARNLNWATQNAPRDTMAMLWANGGRPGVVRCFTTLAYSRLWDADVVRWLREMTQDESNGWHRPPAYTDDKYPSGIYGSDRNVFVFLVNESNALHDGDKPLNRGFFCWNSEVKQMSFGFKAFIYDRTCGNHIVWGAEELFNIRMVHIGEHITERASREISRILGAYINAPTQADQAIIDRARVKQIASTKEEAVEWLTSGKHRAMRWSQHDAVELTDFVEKELGADPTNLWKLVDGATRLSQTKTTHTDERTTLDRRAGQLLEVVF